ncbi:MAG: CPBP family intramembrane glutamic endopeptidase [Gilvibacter sp.]
MYISQAYTGLTDAWRYLVGIIVVFIATQIGSLPFIIAIAMKSFEDNLSPEDFEDQSVLMNLFDSNTTLLFMLLGFAVGLLGLFLWVRYVHKQKLTALTTSRKKIDWGRILFSFGLIAVVTIVLTYIDYKSNPEDYVYQFDAGLFAVLAVIAIVFIPLQSAMEEYVFRGYLMQGIGVFANNKWLPLIITSVAFGGLHYWNPEVDKIGPIIMVYYIGTGFFLGIMTLMDEGLELALGFHIGNNLIAALLVSADWTVFQTESILLDVSEPSTGFDVLVPVLVMYPLFLAIMATRYKWKGWKSKLFGEVYQPSIQQ